MSGRNAVESFVSLQIMRAFAAWLVVLVHYAQIVHHYDPSALSTRISTFYTAHGINGVDLFFVLSGIVMVLTVSRRTQTTCGFLSRRVARIVPTYWVATVLLCGLMLCVKKEMLPFAVIAPGNLVASLLFIPFPNDLGAGYYPVLSVGWTLNFEMTFYVLISVLLFCRRRSVGCWGGASIVFCLLMYPLHSFAGPWRSVFGSEMFYAFPLGLAIGFGVLLQSRIQSHTCRTLLGAGCILSAIALGMVWQQAFRHVPFAWFLGEGRFVIVALLIFGTTCVEGVIVRLPGIEWLKRLGDNSYSTYLFHLHSLCIALTIFGTPKSLLEDLILLLASSALTIVLSEISYRYVEQGAWFSIQAVQQRDQS